MVKNQGPGHIFGKFKYRTMLHLMLSPCVCFGEGLTGFGGPILLGGRWQPWVVRGLELRIATESAWNGPRITRLPSGSQPVPKHRLGICQVSCGEPETDGRRCRKVCSPTTLRPPFFARHSHRPVPLLHLSKFSALPGVIKIISSSFYF